MDISVIICTWNRASSLDKTLRSFCNLQIPAGLEWELLVVNNNCTDNTDDVIAAFAHMLPIRGLTEPRQGLSYARNCGISAGAGELVVFTDDDISFDPGWLDAYRSDARRHPESLCFGGPIRPLFTECIPRWVQENQDRLDIILGTRDFRIDEGPFPANQFPYGGNMAFRRKVFEIDAFDPRLGVCGEQQGSGEETVLFRRLADEGCLPVWVPEARVNHTVTPEMVEISHLWQRVAWQGATFGESMFPHSRRSALGKLALRLQCWRALLNARVRYALRRWDWVPFFILAGRMHGFLESMKVK